MAFGARSETTRAAHRQGWRAGAQAGLGGWSSGLAGGGLEEPDARAGGTSRGDHPAKPHVPPPDPDRRRYGWTSSVPGGATAGRAAPLDRLTYPSASAPRRTASAYISPASRVVAASTCW